jgi:hypothetical protein
MFRTTRTVAAVLALAIIAMPVVLDRCAELCEAHHDTVASAPACHHAASSGTRIAPVPTQCGHDHTGTAVTAAKSSAPTGRAFDSIVAIDTQQALESPVATNLGVRPHSPPALCLSLDGHSLPLRV